MDEDVGKIANSSARDAIRMTRHLATSRESRLLPAFSGDRGKVFRTRRCAVGWLKWRIYIGKKLRFQPAIGRSVAKSANETAKLGTAPSQDGYLKRVAVTPASYPRFSESLAFIQDVGIQGTGQKSHRFDRDDRLM